MSKLLWAIPNATDTVSGRWSDKRREIAYVEARAVIEAQNTTMADIDSKAMRTVRLNAILLGLLFTGMQVAPPLLRTSRLQIAFVLLVAATTCGILTYNESNRYVGLQGKYIESLAGTDGSAAQWEVDFLTTMSGLIAENFRDLRRSSWWLTLTQALLILGIGTACSALAC